MTPGRARSRGTAASSFSNRERVNGAAGARNHYKGIRHAALYRMSERCPVRGCKLEADHRGHHYMGED